MKLLPNLLAAATLAALSAPAHAEIVFDVIGGSEVSFEGLIQADGNWYDEDFRNLNGSINDGDDTDFELRRAEIIVKGKGPGMWNWVIGYDAKADKFLDTNISYRWGGYTTLTVGQYKQPNSLEELSSTRFNDFISKAVTTNIQGMGRRVGIQLGTGGENWTLTGSLFDRELTRRQSPSLGVGQGFGVRGTWAPIMESGHFLHLGASWINMDAEDFGSAPGVVPVINGDGRARFRVRPDADLSGTRLVDSGQFTNVDDITTIGFEGAYVNGPIKIQAEYMTTDADRTTTADFNFDSFYVYGVWNVTGETWQYKGGNISTLLPEDPASGLWQVGLRYDSVDLNDGLVTGGEQDTWTVGVNWYWRSNFKLSANYVMVESSKRANLAAPLISDDPNIFEVRAQFYW